MAVSPLEGLMSVAMKHHLVPAAEPQVQPGRSTSSPTPLLQHQHGTRSVWPAKKWVQPICGSRSSSGSGSVIQSRTLRSQNCPENAARERSRVRNLRQAFHNLQAALPSVPPDTKLSKLDVLVLATNYIAYLTETLDQEGALSERTLPSRQGGYLHPVKKWPMRSLLYCGSVGDLLSGVPTNQMPPPGRDTPTDPH
ncbi:transcription factor 24-like [Thalassophryne amazonica]|uniref:transcription factor 24-like n=1 Tax=Thalassophryne amazonica TaxID=390379 RepID=UPI001472509E|nr:transcription factor 24-like [Thalassophryne amazonica]